MTYSFFQKRAIIVGLLALFGLVSCGDSSSQSAIDNSSEGCLMEPLADDSGIKVMCYGDSVAVLLHGKDGSDGKDGKDGKNRKNRRAARTGDVYAEHPARVFYLFAHILAGT